MRRNEDVVTTKAPAAFGQYRLLERIALGGMAEVFLAVRPGVEGFQKQVAIKRIRPHLSDEDAFVQMFLHEAKLAAQLHHPNIVQIHDLGQIAGSYYIAMEHISGRDMSRVVPKAAKLGIPFPLEYALHIAAATLDGLAYAHAKKDDEGAPMNIVHRDITPENIMVSWTGNVKILDFGIAKATTQTDQTKAGEIKGKLSYMSPEQAKGKTLDARSDIFTLGVVLYEWLTGTKLFTGENEMAVLRSIVDGKIYPPSYFRDDIPPEIEDVLMKALAKDRDLRYQAARDMQYELQQWLHQAEFTPSASHVANFMKQIFADELEAERARHAGARRAVEAVPAPTIPPPIPRDDEAPTQAPRPISRPLSRPELVVVSGGDEDGEALELSLDPETLARLEAAARRSGCTVETLAADLLEAHARYL